MQLPRSEKTKRIVLCGMLTAAAFVLSYVESLFSFSFGAAGVKIGLANIVTLCALYTLGVGISFGVLSARIILVSFTFGSMSALVYSMAGGILSFAVMCGCKKCRKFSITGVGIAGGVMHNMGQLGVASYMLGKPITAYLPFLMLMGALAGTLVGVAAALTVKSMKKHKFY